jgi:hypothetical protein
MVVKGSSNNNNVSTVFLCVFSAVLGYAIAEFRRKKHERIMADDENSGYDNKRSTESERPAPLLSSTKTEFITNIIDGEKRIENQEGETAHYSAMGTNVTILPKEGYLPDDGEIVQQAHDFDVQVISKVKTLQDSKLLLRRTRAVNALASQLMAAPDEESCYQVASR